MSSRDRKRLTRPDDLGEQGHALDLRLRELAAPSRVDALAAYVTPLAKTRLCGSTESVVLHHYELDRVLGRGSRGVVFRAYDYTLDRSDALKVFRSATDEEILREARNLVAARHFNVVTVNDVRRTYGFAYMVVEMIDGWTMRERVGMGIGWPELIDLFVQIGLGLAAVHGAGVLHGEVEPDNMLVARDSRACLAGFGLSRAAGWRGRGEPAPVGAQDYAAPECWGDGDIGAGADQFSFCVALWEALYGERPWASNMEILFGDVEPMKARPLAGAPAGLEEVVRRGLSAQPGDRYPSMDELVAALGAFAAPR